MKSNFIKLMKGSVPETSELTFKADSCLYLASRSWGQKQWEVLRKLDYPSKY